MDKILDLLIVGGGPTGINVAIEAKKMGLKSLIIEKGLLVNSLFHFPANMTFFSTSLKLEIGDIPFISHNEKPTRDEALEYYRRLVQSYQLDIHFRERVLDVVGVDGHFLVTTSRKQYRTSKVVIATGFYDIPRMMNVEGEDLPKVKHYYDEAHHYIGQKIVVVGGANSACDVALETWSKGAEVTMIIRESELYKNVKYWILPNIENRIKEGSIKAYFNSKVVRITEDKVHFLTPEGFMEIENDYVLAMTGYRPDYEFLNHVGITFNDDEFMTPRIDPDTLETELSGIYMAGVVTGGLGTNKLFIENTRDHAEKIVTSIISKKTY